MATLRNIPMKKMMSQITPKHMPDNKILLKLERIFSSIEINPNSTYPLSEPSVEEDWLAWLAIPYSTNNFWN